MCGEWWQDEACIEEDYACTENKCRVGDDEVCIIKLYKPVVWRQIKLLF